MSNFKHILIVKAATGLALIASAQVAYAQRGTEVNIPPQVTTTDRLVIQSADDDAAKRGVLKPDQLEALKAAGLGNNFKVVDRTYYGALVIQLDRRIEVTAPAGSGSVQVRVENPDGRQSNAMTFTYVVNLPPTLNQVGENTSCRGRGWEGSRREMRRFGMS